MTETLLEVAQLALLAYLGWRGLGPAPEAATLPSGRPWVKGEGRRRLRAYLDAKRARRAAE